MVHRPAIVFAGAVQFGRSEVISYPRVESRTLLYCTAGYGGICLDGSVIDMAPGRIVLTDWAYRIDFMADANDPFRLTGTHLIPRHDDDSSLIFDVPHFPDHPLAGMPDRADGPLTNGADPFITDTRERPTLGRLLEYIVSAWATPDPMLSFDTGELIVRELASAVSEERHRVAAAPAELRRVLDYVDAHLSERLSPTDLASMAGISPQTLNRRFRKYLSTSPSEWVRRRRLDSAQLMLSTTILSIGQIARRAGYESQPQFSREFRRFSGASPREWREARLYFSD